MIKEYKNTKVLILGLGLNEGGVGSAKFFAKEGAEVLVTDLKTEKELAPSIEQLQQFPNITYHLGGHNKNDIDWADLIIKNQAVKPGDKYIEYALKQGKRIETDIGIFLQVAKPDNIIGITGTKGKSTTSALIYQILKASGRKVIFSGNIGKSVLDSMDYLDDDTLIVLEISSFQLESFDSARVSPKYAVITNIYPDHLNYYSSMEEYTRSKKLIAIHQTSGDYLFISKDDKTISTPDFLKGITSRLIFYNSSDLPKDFKPQLPGEYNLANIAAALAVSKALRIDTSIALEALRNFPGVEFRLQLIKEWSGIKIYNNTTATAPEPAIESLKTLASHLSGGKLILIAGGMNKGLDYKEFAGAIEKYANEVFFLEGDATDAISHLLSAFSRKKIKRQYNDLKVLLKDVKEITNPGDIILFSPGATSFNIFQNEFDRGRKFNDAVKRVFG